MTDLANVEPNTPITAHPQRGGISITMMDKVHNDSTRISPSWNIGGFAIQFVRLPASHTLALPQRPALRSFLKVICGSIDCAPLRAFPAVGVTVSTEVQASSITATSDAILCLVREIDPPETITDMQLLACSGPHSQLLQWQSFNEKFSAVTDVFKGLDAHMLPGFHLLDAESEEIAYVHCWTTGKGVDVTTHNHSHPPSPLAPAFAETHLVLRNGTGTGAMYQCDSPEATTRERLIVGEGEEHGPFFKFDADTGKPCLRANGAVEYPWHGWQGGEDDQPGQAYDLVAAFEISPTYTRVLK